VTVGRHARFGNGLYKEDRGIVGDGGQDAF
jgi:hypothetical protein